MTLQEAIYKAFKQWVDENRVIEIQCEPLSEQDKKDRKSPVTHVTMTYNEPVA